MCATVAPLLARHAQFRVHPLNGRGTLKSVSVPQQKLQSLGEYAAHIRRLLAGRACVNISFSPADEQIAAALFDRKLPIEFVEHGILLGCTRKNMTLLTTPNCGLIVSLSYFQGTIEEAATSKVGGGYWQYLRARVDQLEKEWTRKAGLSP